MSTHVVRLNSFPRTADDVIGRLVHGRRPKGVRVTVGLFDPIVRMFDPHVHTTAFKHDVFVVDFHVHGGAVDDVEGMVRAIGGKRATVVVMTIEEWAADMAADVLDGDDDFVV